ncbi:hypothetical protein ABZ646_34960, partial [Streptomyces sp. NPDC007162]|uniref:hypothetical protein n=1 Tax=Streptomyces sp. NPDC007162 TaxID=3156917 RepID=UPI0033F14819
MARQTEAPQAVRRESTEGIADATDANSGTQATRHLGDFPQRGDVSAAAKAGEAQSPSAEAVRAQQEEDKGTESAVVGQVRDGVHTPSTGHETSPHETGTGRAHDKDHPAPGKDGTGDVFTPAGPDPLFTERADQWNAYRDARDARTDEFLRFQRDLGRPDEALSHGYANFAQKDLFGGRYLPKDSVGHAQAEADFHRAVLDDFKQHWQAKGSGPLDAAKWAAAYEKHRANADRFFANASSRHRELENIDKDFSKAVDQAREGDVFGGRYLREAEGLPRREDYETDHHREATYDTDNGKPRPGEAGYVPTSLSHLRADTFAQVRSIVDKAHREFPDDPVVRLGSIDRQISALREHLPQRIALLADSSREVEHATRRLDDHLFPDDHEDRSDGRGALDEDNLARLRGEFQDDLHTAYQRGRNAADPGPRAERAGKDFEHAWQQHLDRVFETLDSRIGHAEFRQFKNADLHRQLKDAFDQYEEGFFQPVDQEARDRLTKELTHANEKAVDEHWYDHSNSPDTRSHVQPRWDGDGNRPARSYDDNRALLDAQIEARIDHELALRDSLERAAKAFHPLGGKAGSDAPKGERLAPADAVVKETADDFGNETVRTYDKIFAPHEHNIDAWLHHEKDHGDTFGNTLNSLPSSEPPVAGPHSSEPGSRPGSGPESAPESGTETGPVPEAHAQGGPEPGPRPGAESRSAPGTGQDHPGGGQLAQATVQRAAPSRNAPVTSRSADRTEEQALHEPVEQALHEPASREQPTSAPSQNQTAGHAEPEPRTTEAGAAGAHADADQVRLTSQQEEAVARAGTSGTAEQRIAAWQDYQRTSDALKSAQQRADEAVRNQDRPEWPQWKVRQAIVQGALSYFDQQRATGVLNSLGMPPERVHEYMASGAFDSLREPLPEQPHIAGFPLPEDAVHGEGPQSVDALLGSPVPQDAGVRATSAPPVPDTRRPQQQERDNPVADAAALPHLAQVNERISARAQAYADFETRRGAFPGLWASDQVGPVREWYADAREGNPAGDGEPQSHEQLDQQLGQRLGRLNDQAALRQRTRALFDEEIRTSYNPLLLPSQFTSSTRFTQLVDGFHHAVMDSADPQSVAPVPDIQASPDVIERFRQEYRQAAIDAWNEERSFAQALGTGTGTGSEGATGQSREPTHWDPLTRSWYRRQLAELQKQYAADRAAATASADAAAEQQRLDEQARQTAEWLKGRAEQTVRATQLFDRHTQTQRPNSAWGPRVSSWYDRQKAAITQPLMRRLTVEGPAALPDVQREFDQRAAALQRIAQSRDTVSQDFDALLAQQGLRTEQLHDRITSSPLWTADWAGRQIDAAWQSYLQAREAATATDGAFVPAPSHIPADDWRAEAWRGEQERRHTEYGQWLDQAAAAAAEGEQHAAQRQEFDDAFDAWAADGDHGLRGSELDQVRERVWEHRGHGHMTDPGDEGAPQQEPRDAFDEEAVRQTALARGRAEFERSLRAWLQRLTDPATTLPYEMTPEITAAVGDHVRASFEEQLDRAVNDVFPLGSGASGDLAAQVRQAERRLGEMIATLPDRFELRAGYESEQARLAAEFDRLADSFHQHLDEDSRALLAALDPEAADGHQTGDAHQAVGPAKGAAGTQVSAPGRAAVLGRARAALHAAFTDVFGPVDTAEHLPDDVAGSLSRWRSRFEQVVADLPAQLAAQAARESAIRGALNATEAAVDSWAAEPAA